VLSDSSPTLTEQLKSLSMPALVLVNLYIDHPELRDEIDRLVGLK
jgi:hypothetical protein